MSLWINNQANSFKYCRPINTTLVGAVQISHLAFMVLFPLVELLVGWSANLLWVVQLKGFLQTVSRT